MSTTTEVRERPILFSGPMVRALLDGRKTQTRRIVKHVGRWEVDDLATRDGSNWPSFEDRDGDWWPMQCPYGVPGDRLYVRETFAPMCHRADPQCWCETDEQRAENHWTEYRADTENPYPGEWPADEARGYADAPKWRPSIHMPRSRSRLTLEITEVRVQRVQEIGEEDAKAEGFDARDIITTKGMLGPFCAEMTGDAGSARRSFFNAFFSLNKGRAPADSNPWVWALTFKVIGGAP